VWLCARASGLQVRITNPLDAPLETLGLPPERAVGLVVSYDANAGVLTLTVTPALLTGCALLRSMTRVRLPARRVTCVCCSLA
jgi:hypothetical protein